MVVTRGVESDAILRIPKSDLRAFPGDMMWSLFLKELSKSIFYIGYLDALDVFFDYGLVDIEKCCR